ncbi:hypothetical protein ACIQF6_03210 [Kitasatospora sp. NPDC092948]|uniref:LppU/SCO3897 family protein n=1 Tax=Kitasatospora sp. NPDC092948 TaxID=3364088 RepID=UPI0038238CC3
MSNPVPPPSTDAFAAPASAAPGAETASAPHAEYFGPGCRFCGSVPAVETTVRGHQGFLVLMRFLKVQGPFCRNCGLATVRKMTSDSLWQGWWGLASAVINPITMLSNLAAWSKIRRLAAPLPRGWGIPAAPGRPLWQRVQILGLLVPVLAVGAIVYAANSDPDYAAVGDCIHHTGSDDDPTVTVVDCTSSDAQFKVVGRFENDNNDACDDVPGTDAAFSSSGRRSQTYTLCLSKVVRSS